MPNHAGVWTLNTFHRPDKGDLYFSKALDEACQTPVNLVKLDVSKNRDPPKWMVKIMENPIKMDDLGGGVPLFLGWHPYRLSVISLDIQINTSGERCFFQYICWGPTTLPQFRWCLDV